MSQKFACAINNQGSFAPTKVADFHFVPDIGAHVWKGQIASNMAELAEQMNGAFKSWKEFGNPFLELRVIPVGTLQVNGDEESVTEESTKEALLEANRQLNETIVRLNQRRITLPVSV